MKAISCSAAHPDALLNWLVTSSIVEREFFFLECFLNLLDSKIIANEDLSECIQRYADDHGDYMELVWGQCEKITSGCRGRLHDLIVECNWDLEDYIIDRKKEYGTK